VTFTPNQFPPGSYVSFVRNVNSGGMASASVTLTGPVIIYSAAVDGPAAASLPVRRTIYGRITGSSSTQACSEAVGSGACAIPSNWVTFPANGWTWDAATSAWRATIAPNTFPPGNYTSYALDVPTGSRAAPLAITLTLACAWSAVVPGPVAGPTTACTSANEGAMELASGYTWTCTCT